MVAKVKKDTCVKKVDYQQILPHYDKLLDYANTYLVQCVKDNTCPSIAGYAIALGTCKATLYNNLKEYPALQEVFNIINNMQEQLVLDKSFKQGINSGIAIFLLKNNGNKQYVDKQEVEHINEAEGLKVTFVNADSRRVDETKQIDNNNGK
jgi:hypothetical protein